MKAITRVIFIIGIAAGALPAYSPVFSTTGVQTIIKNPVSAEDTSKINSLIKKGFLSIKESSKGALTAEKTELFIDSATFLCEKNKIDFPPLLHLLKAEFYFVRSDFNTSEQEAAKCIEKAQNIKDYMSQAKGLIFLGKYYHRTGSFSESMDAFTKCISLSEEKKLKGIIPSCYYGQAKVMKTVGDLKGESKYYELQAEAALNENSLRLAMDAWCSNGSLFLEKMRDSRKADSLLKKCLNMSLERKDSIFTAFSSAQLGWNFYLDRMFDSSIYYYNKSLSYSLPSKQYSSSANSLGNLGTINRDLGNYNSAISYYGKAIEQAIKVNDWYNLQWIYMDMSNMYLSQGDTSNAYINYVLYKKYSDDWIKSETAKGITEARIKYEVDTHNKELALLSLRLKNNRILNIGFGGLILLTVTIGLLLFRGSKLKDRHRISEMNHKISELTQANLRQQMNPHFIFNTLNSIQYYMYQNDKLATNTYLTKFSSLMRKILDNSTKTSIPLRDELDALTLYLDLERLRFKDKFNYEIYVDEEIDPLLYKVPTMLIQPYVENSICHGLMPKDENGVVKIGMKLNEDHIVCTIEDNGIGRQAAQERRKMKDPNHNSLGTRIVSSRLDLVNSLYGTSLNTVYTDLKNEQGEPEGTRVEIHIPVIS